MSSISTARARSQPPSASAMDDREELTDLPFTPREGWTSVISLAVMMLIVGIAIDDARWAGFEGGSTNSQTGFLPMFAVFSVLVGTALAKSRLGRYRGHLVGAVIGALLLLNFVSSSISNAPSLEGRLHDLNLSVSRFIEEVVVQGSSSYEMSIFLLILGALVWAAGQFGAYAVFARHRPLPAILLTGFILLLNVSITLEDEYLHLIVFVAAALVLLVRLNLLGQAREWRARGMRDVAGVSGSFMRNGAAFVALAIVAATTLAANASSAPLARMWSDFDDELLEIGYAIHGVFGGVTGSVRGPNILFTPTQTITGAWQASSEPVFSATTTDDIAHWRGATYDSFDGTSWSQLDRQSILVETGGELLEQTPERMTTSDSRHQVTAVVTPIGYGGDVIVAPESPHRLDQPAELVVNGPNGPFVAAELVNGVQPGVPYTVISLVRQTSGRSALSASELAVSGRSYPSWVNRYLEIRPGSVGDLVGETADRIVAGLQPNKRDPYRIAHAIQAFLHDTGGFQYNTDVRGLCEARVGRADCLLQTKQGYCEYFASAMVMMLREQGIPARYVVGYLPGREQPDGSWLVDRSAAHAWVEVYYVGHGWVEFDPTPGNFENGQAPTNLPIGDPNATPGIGIPGQGELEGEGTFPPLGEGSLPPPPPPTAPPATPDLLPVVAIILLVSAALVLAGIAALRRSPSTEPEIAYRGVTRLATRLGYGPRPAQTAYEFAAGLGELVPVASADLRLIATAKVEATYGRRRPGNSMLRTLARAYRRVQFGLLRLMIRRPKLGLRPRSTRPRKSRTQP
jgi:hypothetical protein